MLYILKSFIMFKYFEFGYLLIIDYDVSLLKYLKSFSFTF